MRPALLRSRVLTFALVSVLAGGGLVACGGDSEQDQQEALEQARAEGRKQEREKARQKEFEQKTKDLEKEVKRLKKGSNAKKSSGGGGSTATRNASSGGGGGGASSCGSGITVNSVTSCEFAHIVRDAYYGSGGSSSISAHSPVTGMSYSMTCTTTGSTTCRGGNNAQVTFP